MRSKKTLKISPTRTATSVLNTSIYAAGSSTILDPGMDVQEIDKKSDKVSVRSDDTSTASVETNSESTGTSKEHGDQKGAERDRNSPKRTDGTRKHSKPTDTVCRDTKSTIPVRKDLSPSAKGRKDSPPSPRVHKESSPDKISIDSLSTTDICKETPPTGRNNSSSLAKDRSESLPTDKSSRKSSPSSQHVRELSLPTNLVRRESSMAVQVCREQSSSVKNPRMVSNQFRKVSPRTQETRKESTAPGQPRKDLTPSIQVPSKLSSSHKFCKVSPSTHQMRREPSPSKMSLREPSPLRQTPRPQSSPVTFRRELTPRGAGQREPSPLLKSPRLLLSPDKSLREPSPSKMSFREPSPSSKSPRPLSSPVKFRREPTPRGATQREPTPRGATEREPTPRKATQREPTPRGATQREPSPLIKSPRSLLSHDKPRREPTPRGAGQREQSPLVKSPRLLSSPDKSRRELTPRDVSRREPSPAVTGSKQQSSFDKYQKLPSQTHRGASQSDKGRREASPVIKDRKPLSSSDKFRKLSQPTDQIQKVSPRTDQKVPGQSSSTDKFRKELLLTNRLPSTSLTSFKDRRATAPAVKGPREPSPIYKFRKLSSPREKVSKEPSPIAKLRKEFTVSIKDNKGVLATGKDHDKQLSTEKVCKNQKESCTELTPIKTDKDSKAKQIFAKDSVMVFEKSHKDTVVSSKGPEKPITAEKDEQNLVELLQDINLIGSGEGRIETIDSAEDQKDEINFDKGRIDSIGAGEGNIDAVGAIKDDSKAMKEMTVFEDNSAVATGTEVEEEEPMPAKELSVIYEVTEPDTESDRDREEEARRMDIEENLLETDLTEVDLLHRHRVLLVHVVYDGQAEDTYFKECTLLVQSKTRHYRIVTNDCARNQEWYNPNEAVPKSFFNWMPSSITGFFRNPIFWMRSVAAAITSYRQNRSFKPTLIFVDAHPIVIPILKLAFSCPVVSFAFYQEILLRKKCGIMASKQMMNQVLSHYCLKLADEIFVPSFSVGKKYLQLVNDYNYCPQIFFPPVVGNMVMNERVTPLPSVLAADCELPIYFLIIGPWHPQANFHFALSVLDYFYTTLVDNESHKNRFVFLFVGFIDNDDEQAIIYRNEIGELIRLLPVDFRRRIRIINNPSPIQMWEYYRDCIAVINLTEYEDFNWTLMECHYFGRPLITLKSPFSTEIIENGFNGYLMDPISIKFAKHLFYIYSWIGQHFLKNSTQFFADNFSRAQRSRAIQKIMLKYFPLTDDETFE